MLQLQERLIAFNVPSGLPYWIAIVGCFVAIIIVKQLFGGIGKNLVNPAITARIVLFIIFCNGNDHMAGFQEWQQTAHVYAQLRWAYCKKAAENFLQIWKCSWDTSAVPWVK